MKHTQLVKAIQNVNGASFIGLDTVTNVVLSGGKKNPLQGCVTKHMKGASVMVFSNKNTNGYEAMIERRLIQEGKDPTAFQLGPRAWGTRVPNMPIVEHKNNYYLEVIFLKAGTVHYEVNGVVTDPAYIVGMPERKENEDSQGGLENKVIIRTFAADSIVELRVDGKVFN